MLSGGERNRVHLAKMLKTAPTCMLLDEPTNDLDVDTLRALEEALQDFAGCAVIISHDRWFLDRLATHILAFEGDSQVEWFEGNFQAYEEDKHAPRHGGRPAAPDQVPAVDPIGSRKMGPADGMRHAHPVPLAARITRTPRLTLIPPGKENLPDLIRLKADPRVFELMLHGVRSEERTREELRTTSISGRCAATASGACSAPRPGISSVSPG